MKGMRAAVTLVLVVCSCWVYAKDPATFDLLDAIENGDLEGVKTAIEKGADLKGRIIENYTPLALAIDYGHIEIVKALIDAGADVNAEACGNPTALFLAASKNNVPMMKILIGKGADVNAEGPFGQTVLLTAIFNFEVAKLLLESGANADAVNKNEGWTALMLAVREGDIALVKLLLEAGADPEATGGGSQSAVDWAQSYKKKDIEELLKQYASKK